MVVKMAASSSVSSSSALPSTYIVDMPQYYPCSSSNCQDSESDGDSNSHEEKEVASLLDSLKSPTPTDMHD